MSTHVDHVTASAASLFISSIAGQTGEDWQAGGAFRDIIEDLKREGHVSDDLYVAGCRLILDMTRCHGTSHGLVSRYGDQVDGGEPSRLPPRHLPDIDAFNRMDRILGSLRRHERELLTYCVTSRDHLRGGLTNWGKQRSRYTTAKTARAHAVGQVRALLESIFELYKLHSYPS